MGPGTHNPRHMFYCGVEIAWKNKPEPLTQIVKDESATFDPLECEFKLKIDFCILKIRSQFIGKQCHKISTFILA